MLHLSKEQKEDLFKFNNQTFEFPWQLGLNHVFEDQCKINPSAIALEFNNTSLTYRELNERANKIANYLILGGTKPGNMIGICAERSLDMVAGVLGILKSGAAYVPFDPNYPTDRIQYMLSQSEIKTILIHNEFRTVFSSSSTKLVALDSEWHEFEKLSVSNPQIELNDRHPAYVLFTSGSTGMPKGVVMGHHPLVNLIEWQKTETSLTTAARTLQFAPISFDVSFQEMFTTWSTGGTLVLIEDDLRLNAIRLLRFIEEKKIERLFLPFIALQHLCEVAQNSHIWPKGLKDVITAGEQLQITRHIQSFFDQLSACKLHNHYGPTETHVVTAITLEGKAESWPSLPPIGKPIAHTHVYLLDENLLPVKNGEQGEIYIAGVALAQGYINRDDLTAERFLKNPFEKSGCIYKTGDIGRYLPDGNIEYLGRTDSQVKVRGYRIELGEIEVALSNHPEINQVAVVVREDEPGDKRLVAYLVATKSVNTLPVEIRKYLNGVLPEYMLPSSFVFLKSLPKTPSGKIDRKSLPKPDESRPDIGTIFLEPSTPDEKNVALIWSQLLRINKVGVHDNFFDLGGNSLLALQSIAKLKQQHGLDISVVKLYRYPTIAGLLKSLNDLGVEKSVVQKMRERFSEVNLSNRGSKNVEDGIAIIGMSGRFPGAGNVEELWNNLLDGKETVSFFGPEDLDPFIDQSLTSDPSYVKARGVIRDVDKFDAGFFGVNPRLAELMDPQQRIFLEVCWEALENAGYTSSGFKGLIGVYSGMGNNTYYTHNVIHHKDAIEKVGPFQVMVANEKDYIATRVSHFMNLTGPGLSVHTACSTSLTAVAMACQNLWNRRCDMAIAGGIAITSPVNSGHVYQEGGMFSADGHTRSFDKNASGTVFSDGCGTVVLKRYREAVADGDTIYAVIRGVGINNDGADKASFTAPSVEGQAAAIAMAHADAEISPDTVTYVETHGTATPLGDPIEVEALSLAFESGSSKKQFCALGSIKSNFGHLTAAAGVAGLIKAALSLQHKLIPASLNYSESNPAIDFKNSPFYVNSQKQKWNRGDTPLRAGVSSFGVGGTNVHIVMEEAPEVVSPSASRSKHLLFVSTRDKSRTDAAIENLSNYFTNHSDLNPADVAFTLQTGRVGFVNRRFVVVDNLNDAIYQLQQKSPVRSAARELSNSANGVAFMFPGQGSQYVNMGANLYRDEIIFKEAVDTCAEILMQHLNFDLRTILYPAKGNEKNAATELQKTCFTQPALFAIGYALSKLWMSWGVKPSALIGHSIGEFCAACIAGVMSLEDALMLVAYRGKMMQALPGGSMLSVRLSAEDVVPHLKDSVSVAAINGPSLCVVSGDHDSIDKIQKQLEAKEIVCKKLFTSHAFHSPMMDPIVTPFKELVSKIKLLPPSIPIVSTATAQILTSEQATSADYWSGHLRKPVLFADGIKRMWNEYPNFFLLEMGPRNSASSLARQQVTDFNKQFAYPSLSDTSENDAEWETILFAIGQLWLSGINISWNDFYALEKRKHIPLPTYPFERKRFWVDPVVHSTGWNNMIPENPFLIPAALDQSQNNNQNLITQHMNTSSRKERIITELKNVMEEASGIELASAGEDVTFMELGMDSLFLTQAALTISKKYGTKITFRQMNESYSSLGALATHIDSVLPADAMPSPTLMPFSNSNLQQQGAGSNAQQGNVQWLIMQQMQIMQQQLAALGGSHTPIVNATQHAPLHQSTITPAGSSEVSENEKAELEKPFGAIARIEKAVSNELSDKQKKWLKKFTVDFNKKTAKSKTYTQDHRSHLADPRVVTGFKPNMKELIYQAVVERSLGCRMWDIDGNEYVDVLNGFGSNFLGYKSPIIMRAVEQQLEMGFELGPQHPLAGEMTKLICEFTGYDRVGLCNTGSEAVLGAMRIARTVTGRSTIVCFNGSYHGINDEVIVRGTRKLKSFPAAAGIPPESVQNMLVLDYGTDEALEIIRSRADEIAAVMIEPIQSRRADFRPKEFIAEVRKITKDKGCLLIFDEVITGFRLLPGGAQEFFDVKADISTYGKVIGGGMPIGAIAGKREYMDALDGGFWKFGDDSVPEVGVTYFAGTFVRHPLALAAGIAVLKHLKERGMSIYEKLNGFTDRLINEVNAHCTKTGASFHLVSFGSLFKVKWDVEEPYGELLFLVLRHNGLHIYDGFPCFFTDAFSDADVEFVIAKFIEATRILQTEGFLSSGSILNGKQQPGKAMDAQSSNEPPVAGAKQGKDQNGNPAWFIADPKRPGKFIQVTN